MAIFEIIYEFEQCRNADQESKILHNNITYTTSKFFKNEVRYFSQKKSDYRFCTFSMEFTLKKCECAIYIKAGNSYTAGMCICVFECFYKIISLG